MNGQVGGQMRLYIVGVLDFDLAEQLKPSVQAIIKEADFIFGAKRHLGLADGLLDYSSQKVNEYQRPIKVSLSILARLCLAGGISGCVGGFDERVSLVFFASGDPFEFGIGATIVKFLEQNDLRRYFEVIIFPALSISTIFAANFLVDKQDLAVISLCSSCYAVAKARAYRTSHTLFLTSNFEQIAEIYEDCRKSMMHLDWRLHYASHLASERQFIARDVASAADVIFDGVIFDGVIFDSVAGLISDRESIDSVFCCCVEICYAV